MINVCFIFLLKFEFNDYLTFHISTELFYELYELYEFVKFEFNDYLTFHISTELFYNLMI